MNKTQNKLHQKHFGPMTGLGRYCTALFFFFLSGCAAVALTGAGVGVSYTLTNVAYRSFSSPVDKVHNATIAALKKMGIMITDDSESEAGRTITAETSDLDIVINLEKITSKTTQVKVDARKNILLKDKATAAEIINQMGKILGE
jgi:Protein of unknown function (DUF3568)